MIKRSFVPPEYMKNAFNCPFCNVYATQVWGKIDAKIDNHYIRFPDSKVSRCSHCMNFCLWKEGIPIYPDISQAPLPNPDLPRDIKKDFEEARAIMNTSPRAASGLLRSCIRKLCIHLGEKGKTMDNDIDALLMKGLNPKIIKSLDKVRVTGKDAVPPGTIDTRDNLSVALQLSQLINIISSAMITQARLLDELNETTETKRRELGKTTREPPKKAKK